MNDKSYVAKKDRTTYNFITESTLQLEATAVVALLLQHFQNFRSPIAAAAAASIHDYVNK